MAIPVLIFNILFPNEFVLVSQPFMNLIYLTNNESLLFKINQEDDNEHKSFIKDLKEKDPETIILRTYTQI